MGWFSKRSDIEATVVPETPMPQVQEPATKRRSLLGVRKQLSRMFKAAQVRSNNAWTAQLESPDDIITKGHRILVARSREQWANNDYVKNLVRLCRQGIVGHQGILLQARAKKSRGGKLDNELNDAVETAWNEWCKPKNCDVKGLHSMWKMQRLAVNTAVRDGEFIFRKIYGPDAGPWGFSLQAVDPQRLPPDYNIDRLTNGGFIRHGIEFNRYGRPVFFHFSTTDESEDGYYSISGRGFSRVHADQIIHGFVEEMVGQKRGLPWTSCGLLRLNHLAGFELAAVENARAGATKMGFIKWKEGFGPEAEEDEEQVVDAEPLSFHELPQGAELADWMPQFPNNETASFTKAMLRGAAAGWGVLYNNVAGDLEGVNFSSIRQGTLDERDHWKDLQQWLVESLLQPVFDAWLEVALLSGRIVVRGKPVPATRIDTLREILWQPRRWQWIDPGADVEAAVKSKNNMLASPSQIILDSGRDPMDVWSESARDVRAMIDAYVTEGIPDDKATEMVMLSMAVGRLPLKESGGQNQQQQAGN